MNLPKVEVVKKFLKNPRYKRLIYLLVILAAIPVTVALVKVSQELRERAAGGPVTLSISPSSQAKHIGESGQAKVHIDPGGASVASLELVITYDPAVLTVTDIYPGPFFTDPAGSIGAPVEVTKNLSTPGKIHYAVGFPLGSGYSSTQAADAAIIEFNAAGNGTTSFYFVISGQPQTLVSDINAQNVLGQVVKGDVTVSSGTASLYFSSPNPPNPQSVSSTFTLDVLADTGGQQIDAVDARISFDASFLEVTNVVEGTEPAFNSYPAIDYDNTNGQVIISANIGTGSSPSPAQGSSLNVGRISFRVKNYTSQTSVTYDFTAGDRNDSNMVLHGTWQTQDPVDILASVASAQITMTTGPTVTPTPVPTKVPTPTPTPQLSCRMIACPATADLNEVVTFTAEGSGPNLAEVEIWHSPVSTPSWTEVVNNCPGPTCSGDATFSSPGDYYVVCVAWDSYGNRCSGNPFGLPSGVSDCGDEDLCTISVGGPTPTSTPQPSATTTPSPTQTMTLRLSFEGKLRSGVDRSKDVEFSYREAGKTNITTASLTTDNNGNATVELAPGNYVFLVDADGYLARRYGSNSNPITVTQGQSVLNFSSSPLLGGDFNGDGEINEVDYTVYFLNYFLKASSLVDLDGSGEVNNLDFAIMRANWSLIDDTL